MSGLAGYALLDLSGCLAVRRGRAGDGGLQWSEWSTHCDGGAGESSGAGGWAAERWQNERRPWDGEELKNALR